MKEINEMYLKELFEAQRQMSKAIEERVQMLGEKIAKKYGIEVKGEETPLVLRTEESIQTFLDGLVCATIREFKVLKWTVDPEFRIVTDRRSFTLHSNDIGIFIDEILDRISTRYDDG